MKTPLFLLLIAAPSFAEQLPNPLLFPTTRAIHEVIKQKTAPEAAEFKLYTESVPMAGGSTFEMLPIPAGTFKIGSPVTEKGRGNDEGPQKEITIEPFWMAKVEITWDLYRPFMENGKARNKNGTLNRDSDMFTNEPPEIKAGETLVDTVAQPTPPYMPMHFDMGEGYSKDYPVVNVTYHAANKFCEWLTSQTGHFYRLPTEAEWEYACRAGTTSAYSFGEDPSKLGEYAWYRENSEFEYQKVGTKKPNPWGLHDMHGNVAELVLDQYVTDAFVKIHNGSNHPWIPPTTRYPTGFRGGHWDADPPVLRSAARDKTDPELKQIDCCNPKSLWYFTNAPWLGFRVVRPLETPGVEEMHRYWNMGPGPGDQDN